MNTVHRDNLRDLDEKYLRSRKKRTASDILLRVLVVVLSIGFVISGWFLAKTLLGYHASRHTFKELANQSVILPTPQPQVEATAEDPVVLEPPIQVNWEYLHTINPDIVAWLHCPNSIINYPVMQATDNDFYLYRDSRKEYSVSGSIFADADSSLRVINSNFIIYGHNMKDGSMFHSLIKYQEEDFYKESPVMYLLTPDADYRIEFFASRTADATSKAFTTFFRDEAERLEYINDVVSSAFWVNKDAIRDDCQLITLSTCTYGGQYANPRSMLQGILIQLNYHPTSKSIATPAPEYQG